jgi:hypothetical protein
VSRIEDIAALAERTLKQLEQRFGPDGSDDRRLLVLPGEAAETELSASVCPTCRLLQPAATHCRCCGRPKPYLPDNPLVKSMLTRPSLLPWRRRRPGVDPARLFSDVHASGSRFVGVARRVRATTESYLTRQTCVASGLTIGRDPGDVVLRLVRNEPFLLVSDDEEASLVTGELVLVARPRDEMPPNFAQEVLSPTLFETGLRTWMFRLRIPAPSWDQPPIYSVFETCVRDGDRVEVLGVRSLEIVPGGGVRDQALPVVRGAPGKPVRLVHE